jgi:hypothetical protein
VSSLPGFAGFAGFTGFAGSVSSVGFAASSAASVAGSASCISFVTCKLQEVNSVPDVIQFTCHATFLPSTGPSWVKLG